MTLAVNTLRALAEGVAQRIAANADPLLNITWQATGKYTTGQRGIYLGKIPTDPDEIIALFPRQLTADPMLAESEYGLQVRMRSTPNDPRTVWTLVSAVRDVLLGVWPTTLPGGLYVRTVTYGGGTSLGLDDRNRTEWSENFLLAVGEHRARPS
jgi:hypothetical protein